MTPAESRALVTGAELDRLNSLRRLRARLMKSEPWRLWASEGDRARYLMDIAHLDARRRALRDLLADQLGQIGLRLTHQPRPWAETEPIAPAIQMHVRGRHARP